MKWKEGICQSDNNYNEKGKYYGYLLELFWNDRNLMVLYKITSKYVSAIKFIDRLYVFLRVQIIVLFDYKLVYYLYCSESQFIIKHSNDMLIFHLILKK